MVKKSRSSISANRKLVKVVFLDGSNINIETEVDLKLQDVFDKACHNIEIVDNSLFGLSILTDDNQPRFIDLDSKIVKHAPKSWKSLHQGVDTSGEPVFTVHLLVQYYVEKLSSIRDKEARNYYYRQLRRNFLDYPIMYPDDRCFLLATYSIIAEEVDDSSSFDPREFFPAWVVDKHKSKYIKAHMPSLLNEFASLAKHEAQDSVATALCDETPIGYNMHLYQMTKEPMAKQHSTPTKHCSSKHSTLEATGECLQCTTLYLGIGPKGLEIFEVGDGGFIQSLSHFRWNQIENINYTKKKLELVYKGITTTMYSAHEELSREILTLCQRCHARHIVREKEKIRQSINKSFRTKYYRESYVDSEDTEVDWKKGKESALAMSAFTNYQITAGELYKKERQNRYSIISDAASSTTSGIVSDRTCFSYYDSQEELLNGNKTITSSQDSLLEPSESAKSRPVQRATSEPSKKFEQLRELKVQQLCPSLMSRAASDDTVRSSQKVTDHIYENISEVRSRLMVAAQAKPSKLSPRVLLEPSSLFSKPQSAYSKYKLQVQSQGALNYSMGQLNQLSAMHAQPGFRSQYNMVKPSPSMEQLLQDYQPPPSYNEKHKKVREQMLAAMSQESVATKDRASSQENLISNYKDMKISSHRKTSSDEAGNQCDESQTKETTTECTCRTTSYPEINKLKNMSDLPMIASLFNDKSLQALTDSCQLCTSNGNNNNEYHSPIRPFSWHSESFLLPSSLPAVSPAREGY